MEYFGETPAGRGAIIGGMAGFATAFLFSHGEPETWIAGSQPLTVAVLTLVGAVMGIAPVIIVIGAVHVRDKRALRRTPLVRFDYDHHVLTRYDRPVEYFWWRRPFVGDEYVGQKIDLRRIRAVTLTRERRRPGVVHLWDRGSALRQTSGTGLRRPVDPHARIVSELSLRDLRQSPVAHRAVIRDLAEHAGRFRIVADVDLETGAPVPA